MTNFIKTLFSTISRWGTFVAFSASVLPVSFSPSVAQASTISAPLIPAYFYPGTFWSQAIASSPAGSVMIMNPNSGPGSAPNAGYQAAVSQAQAAGIRVIGYVHTSYGARAFSTVQSEINLYKTWYRVNGIFVDEVAAGRDKLPYYQSVANTIHTNGGLVVINPGTVPDEGYMTAGDVVVVFEGDSTAYGNAFFPDWIKRYDASRFAHLVYQTASGDMVNVVSLSKQRNAGFVYVTDDRLVNPWDTLPSYYANEVGALTLSDGTTLTTTTNTVTSSPTMTKKRRK